MTSRILIVTSDFSMGEPLREALAHTFGDKVSVDALYRVYHVPEKFLPSDIVLSDGTCKDRDDDRPYPVYFDLTTRVKESNATLIPFTRSEVDQPKRSWIDRLLGRSTPIAEQYAPISEDVKEKILVEVRQHLV